MPGTSALARSQHRTYITNSTTSENAESAIRIAPLVGLQHDPGPQPRRKRHTHGSRTRESGIRMPPTRMKAEKLHKDGAFQDSGKTPKVPYVWYFWWVPSTILATQKGESGIRTAVLGFRHKSNINFTTSEKR